MRKLQFKCKQCIHIVDLTGHVQYELENHLETAILSTKTDRKVPRSIEAISKIISNEHLSNI